MIRLCPYCGRKLTPPLECGVATCDNCDRVFNSSSLHRVLSMAWMVRRWHIDDPYVLKFKFGFPDDEIELVYRYVVEEGYCHDEFLRVLDKIDLDISI